MTRRRCGVLPLRVQEQELTRFSRDVIHEFETLVAGGATGPMGPPGTAGPPGPVGPMGPPGTGGGTALGTYAARPAAGNAGAVYMPTDGPHGFVDDGTIWRPILDGSIVGKEPPLVSTWTWMNQGPATAVDVAGSIVLHSALNAANNWRLLTRPVTLPALGQTLTITACLEFGMPSLAVVSAGTLASCIGVTDGTRLVTYEWGSAGTAAYHAAKQWSTATTFNADQATQNHGFPHLSGKQWMRLVQTFTNRQWFWSPDGVNWHLKFSTVWNSYLTPTAVLFGVFCLNNDHATYLYSWDSVLA